MSPTFTCRACGAADVRTVLSLGPTPLANGLLQPGEDTAAEASYPLDLAFCMGCALVQITESVPPDALFRDYPYFSSYSDTVVANAKSIAERIILERRLGPTSLAIEVASNDGYLLQNYKAAGVPVLGIEPARNIAAVAVRERGIPTITEFFGAPLAKALVAEGKRADVLHANNVLAHVPDLPGFAAGVRTILMPLGVAIIEVPYVRDMVDRLEFDTIYHEHLSYFSATSLDRLFTQHQLEVVDFERIDIHGGSLRVTVGREGSARSTAVEALLDEERATGVAEVSYYTDFAGSVAALKTELRGILGKLKGEGKRIAAYGAAAKGSTLLNCFGIGRETIDFVVDRSPHKQGRLMPGVHLPIVPPSRLMDDAPDYTLLLAWNFADEVLAQQRAYRAKGGRFIIPSPQVRIV